MRGRGAAVFVFLLFGVGAPSCGPSLDDTCDASGISGRQVLNDTPPTMTGTFGYVETGYAPYTLTVRYDGGNVSCNASKTRQGCLGSIDHVPASTTVDVLVSLHTSDVDGDVAFDDVHGTLEEDVSGNLTLSASWSISPPANGFCASRANTRLDLTGNPTRSGGFSFFTGQLSQSCGGSSTLGAFTE